MKMHWRHKSAGYMYTRQTQHPKLCLILFQPRLSNHEKGIYWAYLCVVIICHKISLDYLGLCLLLFYLQLYVGQIGRHKQACGCVNNLNLDRSIAFSLQDLIDKVLAVKRPRTRSVRVILAQHALLITTSQRPVTRVHVAERNWIESG